jgi:hypothetical protein
MNRCGRQSTLRIATLCAALSIGSVSAQAPSLPPRPTAPAPPWTGMPAAGAHEAVAGNTRPIFTWAQGGWYIAQTYPTANWFVVCLGDPAQVATCSWPGTWSAAAASIPRVEIVNGQTGVSTGRFRYTFSPYALPASALGNKLLDRELAWNVGACVTQNQSTCSFGTPNTIRFSTRNLTSTSLTSTRNTDGTHGYITYALTVLNSGTSNSGAFDAEVEFWQAAESGGSCVTDPAAPGLQGNDQAVLRDGRIVELDKLPAGMAIEGIIHPNAMGSIMGAFTISGLDPGNSTTVFSEEYKFPWGMTETHAFVAVGRADTSDSVREFNESDNRFGDCKVLFR